MKIFTPRALFPILMILSGGLPLAAQSADSQFSQAELDQMLAPVALYPDVLLSQVLMAATYPLEVVEASRWSQAHPELEGDAAVQAVENQVWDSSVKALVGFPELIQLMDENLSWTRQLGEAFLIQEKQVMETVQILRGKALQEGSLASLEHVTVERQDRQIVIEPANLEVVYVPYYRPTVIYGSWWWADYPPFYWDVYPAYSTHIGFSWSRGYRVSTSFYFSTCNWPRRSIVVTRPYRSHRSSDFRRLQDERRTHRYPDSWKHDPVHRRGIDYRRKVLADRYDRFADRNERFRDRTSPPRGNSPYPDRLQRHDDSSRRIVTSDRSDRSNPIQRPDRTARIDPRTQRPDRSARPDARTQRPDRSAVAGNRPTTAPPKQRPAVRETPPPPPPPPPQAQPPSTDSSSDRRYAVAPIRTPDRPSSRQALPAPDDRRNNRFARPTREP